MIDDQKLRHEIQTRPNLGIIIRGLYLGIDPVMILAILPDPETLEDDLKILEDLGIVKRVDMGEEAGDH